jgi:hypothetical protein
MDIEKAPDQLVHAVLTETSLSERVCWKTGTGSKMKEQVRDWSIQIIWKKKRDKWKTGFGILDALSGGLLYGLRAKNTCFRLQAR